MKYYALKYRYLHTTSRKGNLGDNIQTISVENMLQRLGVNQHNIDYLNRDDLSLSRSKFDGGIFITQGWFGCMPGQRSLPINDAHIRPLYFGFHVNEGSWHLLRNDACFLESLKKYEPIGCRDIATRNFLRGLGIKAFLSRCLTMTFQKRVGTPDREKIFLVDPGFDVKCHIPHKHTKSIVRLSQIDYSTSSYAPSGNWPMTEDDVKAVHGAAYKRLAQFRDEATLVVTGRIHVAMPCAAMGIPVVFCHNRKHDSRISVLKEILPIYSEGDASSINWDPQPPQMESLKREIELMFAYCLQVAENKLGINSTRLSAEAYKNAERLVEHACHSMEDEVIYVENSFNRDDILQNAFGNRANEVVSNNQKLVLFGSGSAGKHLCSVLTFFGIKPDCFCDNGAGVDSKQTCNGLPVIPFDTLCRDYRDSWILIATLPYRESIYLQLLSSGFSEEKIFFGDALIRKYIDFAVPPA